MNSTIHADDRDAADRSHVLSVARAASNVTINKEPESMLKQRYKLSPMYEHRAVNVVTTKDVKQGEELKWFYQYKMTKDNDVENVTRAEPPQILPPHPKKKRFATLTRL